MAYPKKTAAPSQSHEDHLRLERLSFEIADRVHEIGRLVARTLEVRDPTPVKMLTLTAGTPPTASANMPEGPYCEINWADGTKGCHDHEKNICCPGPCPC
jgi:hypothetical protein